MWGAIWSIIYSDGKLEAMSLSEAARIRVYPLSNHLNGLNRSAAR
jgi:hypothetical protein